MGFQLRSLEDLDGGALKQGDEVNLILGAPILDLIYPIFGPVEEEEVIYTSDEEITWPRLLARLQCFPSTSQAIKNWKAQKRNPEIDAGFSGPLSVGKARKIRIWVWKVIPE
jgi:hypothetical protein